LTAVFAVCFVFRAAARPSFLSLSRLVGRSPHDAADDGDAGALSLSLSLTHTNPNQKHKLPQVWFVKYYAPWCGEF
jgi:hypothetical protein